MAGLHKPQQHKLSPRAVRKAVMAETARKPYVLYPIAAGILGALALAILGPSTVFIGMAVAGTGIGLGSWVINNVFRRNSHMARYLAELQQTLARQVEDTMGELRGDFFELKFEPGTRQLDSLAERFTSFETLLRRKLEPGEMTFSRYLGITEQVFLAGLDNLRCVADALRGLSAIDVEQIERRIRHLHDDGIESSAQDQEVAALEERLLLREQRQERIFEWLAENERAMTQIDHVMAAITDMNTKSGHAKLDMEHAMEELHVLAERASRYSSTD